MDQSAPKQAPVAGQIRKNQSTIKTAIQQPKTQMEIN